MVNKKQIVTRAEFARRCGVSAAAITKACSGSLAPAVEGKRIDAAHPAAAAYLAERDAPKKKKADLYDEAVAACQESGRFSASYIQRELKVGYTRAAELRDRMAEAGVVPEGKTEPKPAARPAKPPTQPPSQRPKGNAAVKERKKAEPAPEVDGLPEDIAAVAEMSLRELVHRFGTETRFNDWLKALKAIEDIREKRTKNAEKEGELIPRDLVQTHIIGQFEQAHIDLLNDVAQTMAVRLHAMYSAGADAQEGRDYIVSAIGKTIRSTKATIGRVLRNV